MAIVVIRAGTCSQRHLKKRSSRIADQIGPVPAAPPPSDSADLLQLLAQLTALTAAIEQDLQQHFDSSLAEFEILEALRQRPLAQSYLCHRTHRAAPVISRGVKRLADQGYAASHPPRHDRRERVANLLKRGVNQHQRIRAHLAGMLFRVAQELTPTLEARLLGLQQEFTCFADRTDVTDTGNGTS